ncbi:MAG TPA: hypothetical protein VLM79_39320, partial [Kofleriaceae bacterium]|nr:hypothetical protein [Kofleriaceae bacterium]
MHRSVVVPWLSLVVLVAGCGNKSEGPKAKDDAATGPAAAPLAMPVVGVDQIKRFNFMYEAGAPAYERAAAAYRKKDWPAVRAQADAALAKDPAHLGAHRLLAAGLAQTGDPASAVDHLVTAIAADYLQYAPTLADEDLKGFMASPHGQSVKALAAKIRDEYARRIASGLWLVGRRSAFKWPKDAGVQTSTSRGELYAFDRETRRFFRLTHTEHQLVGFVRPASSTRAGSSGGNSASPGEVAIIGFDKIDRDKPDPAGSESPPLFAHAWLQVLDTTEWKAATPRIALGPAREIAVGYGAGDQLLVSTAPATGRWTVGEPVVSSVDRTTGKLTKATTALPVPRIVVSLDEGNLVRVPDGATGAFTGDPPVTPTIKTAAGKLIQVPESGAAAQSSIAVSPSGGHIAFATAVDPCARDAAPSLYVADAKTGTFKHLLSAKSRFPTRWLDANVLAYEDGESAIRLWDATTGREAMRLEDKAGIALDVLSLAAAPLCQQAPPTVDAAG